MLIRWYCFGIVTVQIGQIGPWPLTIRMLPTRSDGRTKGAQFSHVLLSPALLEPISDATVASFDPAERRYLTAEPGELILLHNLLLHRSHGNTEGAPRRAISVAFIDARSRVAVETGSTCSRAVGPDGEDLPGAGNFPRVFGRGPARL